MAYETRTDRHYVDGKAFSLKGTVSKRFFSLTDAYGVEIAEGEDDILILACAVVIDVCSHEDD